MVLGGNPVIRVQMLFDSSKFSAGMQKAGTKLQGLSTRLEKMRSPLLALSGATVGMAALSVRAFAQFDDAMNQSLAIMGEVSDSMKKEMSDAARQMALTTRFSATEAAQSYFYLASAGLDAKASIEALPVVAQFGQAGMFDMARATDLLTDAQSALGLTIRNDAVKNMMNMVKVSDVLVKANTLANASVEQFSEALTTRAGASLRIVSKDVEEGVAVLAALADQGIKGAEAGTQLGIVLRDLQTKSIANREAFRAFGVQVFDSAGNMNNMADIIGDLEGALDGMSAEQQKSTLLMLGFSDRSVIAIQALLGLSENIKGYEKDLRNAGGTTQEVAEKQLESFAAQLDLARSAVNDAAISIGGTMAPAVAFLAKQLSVVASWISGLPEPLKKGAGAFLAAAAALTAVGLAASLLIPVVTTLGLSVSLALGGIPLLIGGAVAAFFLLRDNWDAVIDAVRIGVNFLGNLLEKAVNLWLDVYINPLIKAYNTIAQVWGGTVDEIEIHVPEWKKANEEVAASTEDMADDVDDAAGDVAKSTQDMADDVGIATSDMADDVEYSGQRIRDDLDRTVDHVQKSAEEIHRSIREQVRNEREKTNDLLAQTLEYRTALGEFAEFYGSNEQLIANVVQSTNDKLAVAYNERMAQVADAAERWKGIINGTMTFFTDSPVLGPTRYSNMPTGVGLTDQNLFPTEGIAADILAATLTGNGLYGGGFDARNAPQFFINTTIETTDANAAVAVNVEEAGARGMITGGHEGLGWDREQG